uniref:Cation efflux protein transmembrane domain-containing protein n=1 Tax=Phlebotomus papatasi TaxID=29031 RepID=A0A1B0GPU0_PHLPP
MFAECIHSLADTINQLILAYGIHKSNQIADSDHPYGYANMKYVSSLISGVGIFCVGGQSHATPSHNYSRNSGCVLRQHDIHAGIMPSDHIFPEAHLGSLGRVPDGIESHHKSRSLGHQRPSQNQECHGEIMHRFRMHQAHDPVIEGQPRALLQSPIPDAVGSLLVGGILGGVALFIIHTNVNALVGRSIRQNNLNQINTELESDVMIRAIHDVKGIDMGNSLVRYKAEVDFDGRELTRSYLDKLDLNSMLEEVKSFTTIDEVESFMLKHGENIVDLMGGEIDRIELKLRVSTDFF